MSWLREMDLYKWIITLSLLLLAPVCWWAYSLQGELEVAKKAVADATKRGGEIEQIGTLQKAVMEQRRSTVTQQSVSPDDFQLYFDRRIQESARTQDKESGEFRHTDYRLIELSGAGAGQGARDKLVKVEFRPPGQPEKLLSRSFLLAMLFNCEAGSPIWKLRDLTISNADEALKRARKGPPPPQLDDVWKVESMVFAARQPSR